MEELLGQNVHSNIFPPEQRREFAQCTWIFLACQTAAAQFFINAHELVCDITVKSHHLAHWALDIQHVNPRRGWCYAGEAYMNKMKYLGAACVRGNKPSQAAVNMCSKYRHGLHFLCKKTEALA
eukprot:4373510-Pyramimonas_sp.AAC.1